MSEHVVMVTLSLDEEMTLDVLAGMSGRTTTALLRSIVADGLRRMADDPLVVEERRAALRVLRTAVEKSERTVEKGMKGA